MSDTLPFSRLVADAMTRRGIGLRELCRQAGLDPSFLSKVLAGKRNPPGEEEVLRRMASVLETDAVELFVAAGRIPSEWKSLTRDPELLRRVDAMMHTDRIRKPSPSRSVPPTRSSTPPPFPSKPFNEELL